MCASGNDSERTRSFQVLVDYDDMGLADVVGALEKLAHRVKRDLAFYSHQSERDDLRMAMAVHDDPDCAGVVVLVEFVSAVYVDCGAVLRILRPHVVVLVKDDGELFL